MNTLRLCVSHIATGEGRKTSCRKKWLVLLIKAQTVNTRVCLPEDVGNARHCWRQEGGRERGGEDSSVWL